VRAISPPGGPATHLSAERRAREITELAEGAPLDLVVIGGGVSGAGAALDAATRGLSVALIERGDLASGTSSRSSKLIHGGLRYLAHGELGIAWESARERAILMKTIAPHLIAPVAQVTPHLTGAGALSKPALMVGMRIGDVLRVLAGSSSAQLPGSRRISRQEATALLPALARDRLRGALLSFDGLLEDDARLAVTASSA
jgi:glycerol-3-phosphate dehydrogenase